MQSKKLLFVDLTWGFVESIHLVPCSALACPRGLCFPATGCSTLTQYSPGDTTCPTRTLANCSRGGETLWCVRAQHHIPPASGLGTAFQAFTKLITLHTDKKIIVRTFGILPRVHCAWAGLECGHHRRTSEQHSKLNPLMKPFQMAMRVLWWRSLLFRSQNGCLRYSNTFWEYVIKCGLIIGKIQLHYSQTLETKEGTCADYTLSFIVDQK